MIRAVRSPFFSLFWLFTVHASLFTIMACDRAPASPVLARIEGRAITQEDLARYVGSLAPKTLSDAQMVSLLDQLVEEEMLALEAERQGLDEDPAFEADLARYRRTKLSQALRDRRVEQALTPEALQSFYREHAREFTSRLVTVRKVFIRVVDPSNEGSWREAEGEAGEVVRSARHGRDLASLAVERSDDAASAPAGRLEQWSGPSERFPAEVHRAALGLQPGEIAEPVKGPTGYYVIRLEEPVREALLSFEQAEAAVRLRVRARALEDLKKDLRGKYNVEILVSNKSGPEGG